MDAPPPLPDLRPLAGLPSATVIREAGGTPGYGDLAVHVGVTGAPLRLRARRRDGRIRISQVLGSGPRRTLHPTRLRSRGFAEGIARFLKFEVHTRRGRRVLVRRVSFCPNSAGYMIDELDRSIAQQPTFPQGCGHVLARAMVWGIDRGWAVGTAPDFGIDLEPGRYRLTVTVDPDRRLRERRRSNNRLRLPLVVKRGAPFEEEPPVAEAAALPPGTRVPDMRALPAYGMSVMMEGGREQLSFSSTVWNAGPGPVWLEGRRSQKRRRRMVTTQLLPRRGARPVRRRVNALVFDLRDGHGHWHYNGLGEYRLLRPGGRVVARAPKQGFCFLPTDPIDLTLPGAVLVPPTDIFGSGSCGRAFSSAVRMRLDAGWGDTYGAGLPGQTLDVTGLPDGPYVLEVRANATGRLVERTKSNNRSRRRIVLGGEPGERTVRVPPVGGLDTEDAGFPR